jgi:hypothetical protein
MKQWSTNEEAFKPRNHSAVRSQMVDLILKFFYTNPLAGADSSPEQVVI